VVKLPMSALPGARSRAVGVGCRREYRSPRTTSAYRPSTAPVVLAFYPGDDTPVCTKQMFCVYLYLGDTHFNRPRLRRVGITHRISPSHGNSRGATRSDSRFFSPTTLTGVSDSVRCRRMIASGVAGDELLVIDAFAAIVFLAVYSSPARPGLLKPPTSTTIATSAWPRRSAS